MHPVFGPKMSGKYLLTVVNYLFRRKIVVESWQIFKVKYFFIFLIHSLGFIIALWFTLLVQLGFQYATHLLAGTLVATRQAA